MTDIEETRSMAHGSMLLDDAPVLDRHLPAGKVDHFCARPPVRGKKRRSFFFLRHKREKIF
jgi:hypothetical protein